MYQGSTGRRGGGKRLFVLACFAFATSCQSVPEAFVVNDYYRRDIVSLTVMPVRNALGNESLNREMNQALDRAFRERDLGYGIRDAGVAIATIQKYKLTKDYSDFLEQYRTTGVANTQLLRLIGAYLKCDAIVLGTINRLERGMVYSGGLFSQYSPAVKLSATLTMLEVSTGQVVWEVSKDITATGSFSAPSFREITNDWAYRAVKTIPPRGGYEEE